MNILIVDDENVQLETLKRGLRKKGYGAVEALSAEEALTHLSNGTKIDLVLTDYVMPGMNGIELLRNIRETYGNLPVIMMTGYGDKELIIDALRNRCDSFIEKPFTFDQLMEEIAESAKALQKAHDELEKRVEERTTELAKSNEEANTSLRVLLRHVGEEKEKLEEEIITNVKKLIMPSIEGLKRGRLGAKERGHVNILATNLTDIISPFSRKLLSKYSNLTPKETQVANLVKEGKTNKEMAELLNVSPSSIELHRHHIRKKLGLISKKVNLKSYLSSLP